MCWTTEHKPALLTAKQDIIVQKILYVGNTGQLKSPIRLDNYWQKNVEYTAEFGTPTRLMAHFYAIQKGFHSVLHIKLVNGYWISYLNDSQSVIFEKSDKEKVFQAIIPKGSKCYINEYGEVVSNKLIIV